jgi:type II secretory pathway component GspD/PulD (secretin)
MSILTLPTLFGSLIAAAALAPEAPVSTPTDGVLLEVTPVIEEGVVTLDVLFKQDSDVYSQAAKDLHLVFDENSKTLTIYDVLVAYGELTDQNFTFTDDVRSYLTASKLNLTHSQVIPKDNVQSWVEHLLSENDFLLDPLTGQGPHLIAVTHAGFLQGGGRTPSAIAVPVEELDRWGDHAATVISTVVTLSNLDVRQLLNSMRTMIGNAYLPTLLPAGNSNSLYISGRAPWVVEMAQMLQTINSAAKTSHRADPAQEMQILRFPLEYAHAGSAAELVEELILSMVVRRNPASTTTIQAGPVRVLADPRTNALLATVKPELVEQLKQAVALIDVEVTD